MLYDPATHDDSEILSHVKVDGGVIDTFHLESLTSK
jgi:hypothetical protein